MAAYVFRVRFRLTATDPDVSVDPETFETVLRKRAATPGEDDWLFFRDNLWKGEVNDERHLRATATETLGVDVESVTFSELVCDADYLAALKAAIDANLELFNAEHADAVVGNYLGSSLRVE